MNWVYINFTLKFGSSNIQTNDSMGFKLTSIKTMCNIRFVPAHSSHKEQVNWNGPFIKPNFIIELHTIYTTSLGQLNLSKS